MGLKRLPAIFLASKLSGFLWVLCLKENLQSKLCDQYSKNYVYSSFLWKGYFLLSFICVFNISNIFCFFWNSLSSGLSFRPSLWQWWVPPTFSSCLSWTQRRFVFHNLWSTRYGLWMPFQPLAVRRMPQNAFWTPLSRFPNSIELHQVFFSIQDPAFLSIWEIKSAISCFLSVVFFNCILFLQTYWFWFVNFTFFPGKRVLHITSLCGVVCNWLKKKVQALSPLGSDFTCYYTPFYFSGFFNQQFSKVSLYYWESQIKFIFIIKNKKL